MQGNLGAAVFRKTGKTAVAGEMNRFEINAQLNKIAEGSEKAFENLYNGVKGGVYSFAYSYMKNREDAEDIVQTVFLKIKKNIDKFDGKNGLPWILQITKNTALSELRSRKVYDNFVELNLGKDEAVSIDENDFDSPVTTAMRKCLSEEEQRIIILHVIWGYKHKEIAELLDMPTGSVTSKYKRAVNQLKKEA